MARLLSETLTWGWRCTVPKLLFFLQVPFGHDITADKKNFLSRQAVVSRDMQQSVYNHKDWKGGLAVNKIGTRSVLWVGCWTRPSLKLFCENEMSCIMETYFQVAAVQKQTKTKNQPDAILHVVASSYLLHRVELVKESRRKQLSWAGCPLTPNMSQPFWYAWSKLKKQFKEKAWWKVWSQFALRKVTLKTKMQTTLLCVLVYGKGRPIRNPALSAEIWKAPNVCPYGALQ